MVQNPSSEAGSVARVVNNSAYHHHHHNISFMELGHLLTRSGLTYPEVSSKIYSARLANG